MTHIDPTTTSSDVKSEVPGFTELQRVLRWLAAVLASIGVAALVSVGLLNNGPLSGSFAGVAAAALAASVVAGAVTLTFWREPKERPKASLPEWPTPARVAGASRAGAVVVFLVAVIAVQTWFGPGGAIAGGDIAPPNGLGWVGRLFAPWVWSGSNLGGPGALEGQAPWAALLVIVHHLGGSGALAQRIWLSLLFAGAGLCAYALLRVLRLGPASSAVGALLYLFNAYTISTVGADGVYLAAMVLVAGYPAAVVATIQGRLRVRTGILLLALGSPLLGYAYANPPLVLMVAAATALTVLGSYYIGGAPAFRRGVGLVAGAAPLILLASTYWLVPDLLQLRSVATGQLASVSSWAWTEGRATLTNGFWLNNTWGWKYRAYYPYAPLYRAFPLALLKFLLPAVAFAALGVTAVRRHDRLLWKVALAAAAGALFLVVLSTGTKAPGSAIFDPLYHLPYGWLLQDPGRFLMAAGLCYAILVAVTLTATQSMLRDARRVARPPAGALARPRGFSAYPWTRDVAGVAGLAAVVSMATGLPLLNGSLVPGPRPPFPSDHVTLPLYWKRAAAFLNHAAPRSTVLVLPPDDFYQMPYTWYYGNDGFIADLLTAHVIDPSGQGYSPATGSLLNLTQAACAAILAHDWPLVQRTLQALGANEILLRGDVIASFPGRHIASPVALARALKDDPQVGLSRQEGPLGIYKVRGPVPASGVTRGFVTVNTRSPDPRDLALLPEGTPLVTASPYPGHQALFQVPPVSTWQLTPAGLATTVQLVAGWNYLFAQLAPTSANKVVAQLPSAGLSSPYRATEGQTRRGPDVTLTLGLPSGYLTDTKFQQGKWGRVGNCDARPGTTLTAHISARVLPSSGPSGLPALRLSARSDAACESQTASWRSGAVYLSLWTRRVSGSSPEICLWEAPLGQCAPLAPLSPNSSWTRFAAVVSPPAGTKTLSIFLYAYGSGVDEYSDVTLTRLPSPDVPIILGKPVARSGATAELLSTPDAYASGWTGPAHARYVRIDGIRGGWLARGVLPAAAVHYVTGTTDLWLGVFPSLVAAVVTLLLLLQVAGSWAPLATGSQALRRSRNFVRSRRSRE